MTLDSSAPPRTFDTTGTNAIPFSTLVKVELRKMIDTRAGLWLVMSIAAVTALVLIIQLWVVLAEKMTVGLQDFMTAMNTPMGIFLPVLGIMSVTSEWSQRTAMVSFTLEPSRLRLLLAKFTSTLLVAVMAVVVGLVLGVVANLIYGALSGNGAAWGLSAKDVFFWFLMHVFGMATGFAFGMLLLNSAAAIVLYFVYAFVLPGLFQLGTLLDWFKSLQPWIDFSAAQGPLLTGHVTSEQWAHLATSGLLWLVLPLVVGLMRVLRAEVK